MKKEKITALSKILRREFYIDLFTSKEKAKFLIMYYGGSGVDRTKYEKRSKKIIPVFDTCFLQIEQVC
ncbi:MAG: hypothetical protein A2026_18110 [Deltaproteobacteria bacterium RBG_19FT_COMBO_46_12]|nr:MAG: hypothetical protein A2026_18110 [Deltaproteobacteria bacterium RBG_19FT_COMBO_46_12]